ncbi:MAG: lysogenization regulator HflD, partial [Cellvibrionaceae bacterium]|nr:lysogenization regulator HflD [Cellvibrionaceae bacterium]
MASKNWREQALALAGVFQATALVDQIARSGYIPTAPYETSIASLFEQNPASAEAVYGAASQLEM